MQGEAGFGYLGLGFRVQGSGFRVSGVAGFGYLGLASRVVGYLGEDDGDGDVVLSQEVQALQVQLLRRDGGVDQQHDLVCTGQGVEVSTQGSRLSVQD